MPRDKEIKYFWAKQRFGTNTLYKNLFVRHPHFRTKRGKLVEALKNHFVNGNFNFVGLMWDLKYFTGTQDNKWYESLFDNTRLSGDISPRYAELTDATVASVHRDYPNARVIISLRDPIERGWARAKMHLMQQRGKQPEEVEEEALIRHVSFARQTHLNDYVQLVERWKRHFGERQVMVVFFDELKADPNQLMTRICDFLAIDPIVSPEVRKQVNKGLVVDIPPKVLEVLVDINYPFIQSMQNYFNNAYVRGWLEKYR
jgi:hypothetical protein